MDITSLMDPAWLAAQLGVNVVFVALVVALGRALLPAVSNTAPNRKLLRRGIIAGLCAIVATIQTGSGVHPALLPPEATKVAVWLTLWLGTTLAALGGFHLGRWVITDKPSAQLDTAAPPPVPEPAPSRDNDPPEAA